MNPVNKNPKTLMEAVQHFSVYENAHAFMVNIRWPGGEVCCPTCGSVRVRYIQTRRQWECRESHPKRRFSLKTGTIMEDSPLPLEKWLAALWLEVNSKNSISSWEAHRSLGVTPKPAQPVYASSSLSLRKPKRPRGFMAKYKYHVGLRSFIFQCIFAGWTAMFGFIIISSVISAAAPNGERKYNSLLLSPAERDVAEFMGITSAMFCMIGGWAVIAVPCGIAALATLESNKM